MTTIASDKNGTNTTVAHVAKWLALAAGDDGQPVACAQYTDKSVQVTGIFGGATLAIEGSNNGVDWATLTDPQGNALNFATAKIELVSEATHYVRPKVTGGDGTTNLAVYVLMKE